MNARQEPFVIPRQPEGWLSPPWRGRRQRTTHILDLLLLAVSRISPTRRRALKERWADYVHHIVIGLNKKGGKTPPIHPMIGTDLRRSSQQKEERRKANKAIKSYGGRLMEPPLQERNKSRCLQCYWKRSHSLSHLGKCGFVAVRPPPRATDHSIGIHIAICQRVFCRARACF